MRIAVALGACLLCGTVVVVGQEPTMTNSVGMEFVLVRPGKMVVGRFQPPYAKPPDPSAPVAAAAGAGTSLAPSIMAAADSNNDKRLSRSELLAVADIWFATLDPERTGLVSQQEFAQRFAAVQNRGDGQPAAAPGRGGTAPGAGAGRGGRGGTTGVLFTAADADRNGTIGPDELRALFDRWFTAWDSVKAGSIDADRLVAGLNAALPLPAGGGRGTPLTADEYRRIEAAAKADSLPGFPVTIDRPYYIGKFEVTQAQWRAVMGNNPSIFQGALVEGSSDNFPVENVTWTDAQAFLRRLNALEKTTRYRLPTEFEWEFAARAGAEDDISWADIRMQAWAGSNRSTQAVGKMKPNAWGLYDMLGNVWEWVQDFYNEKLFADPTPPRSGTEHVLKGAGFVSDVKNATYMTHAAGPGSKFDVGFRVVREPGN